MKNQYVFVVLVICVLANSPQLPGNWMTGCLVTPMTDAYVKYLLKSAVIRAEHLEPVDVLCLDHGKGTVKSGLLHLQAHVTINPKWSIANFHFELQRLTGVGVTSGDVYHGVGGNHSSTLDPRTGETFTRTSVINFQLIGPDNKFQMHQTVHLTINANGEVTSTVSNFDVDCQ